MSFAPSAKKKESKREKDTEGGEADTEFEDKLISEVEGWNSQFIHFNILTTRRFTKQFRDVEARRRRKVENGV